MNVIKLLSSPSIIHKLFLTSWIFIIIICLEEKRLLQLSNIKLACDVYKYVYK